MRAMCCLILSVILILPALLAGCSQDLSETTRIYEGLEGSSIYYDRPREREKILVRDSNYLFRIYQKTKDNRWVIIEKTPVFPETAAFEPEHLLYYMPQARHIDFAFAVTSFSSNPLGIENNAGRDYLVLYYSDNSGEYALIPLEDMNADMLTRRVKKEAAARFSGKIPDKAAVGTISWPPSEIYPKMACTAAASFMLGKDSSLFFWGGSHGRTQAGGMTAGENMLPSRVAGSFSFRSVSGGYCTAAALSRDRTVWVWGRYSIPEDIGINRAPGIIAETAELTVIEGGLKEITSVSAGSSFTLALSSDGTVWAWGLNKNGQLGDGTQNDSDLPVQVKVLSDITAIAAGGSHALALKEDGTVWAWGSNSLGQLGDGTTIDRNSPVRVLSHNGKGFLAGVRKIAAGGIRGNSCAIDGSGDLYVWGSNDSMQLAAENRDRMPFPLLLEAAGKVTAVSVGAGHILALKADRSVLAWGDNWYGQCGDGTDDRVKPKPVQVAGLSDIAAIETTGAHCFAVDYSGKVFAWGNNYYGQLGDGTTGGIQKTPVTVNIK